MLPVIAYIASVNTRAGNIPRAADFLCPDLINRYGISNAGKTLTDAPIAAEKTAANSFPDLKYRIDCSINATAMISI